MRVETSQVVQWFGIPCQCRACAGVIPGLGDSTCCGTNSAQESQVLSPLTTSTETCARLEPVFHKKEAYKGIHAPHTGKKPVCSRRPVP